MRRIYINTDASFNPATKEGGFGIWIQGDSGFCVKRGGKYKSFVSNCYEAEIKAVINALHIAVNSVNGINKIIIICDNLNVVNMINKKSEQRSKAEYKHLYIQLFKLLSRVQYFEARYVRGHQKKINTVEAYINTWCDKMASIAVRYNIC
jgi:ribonuclease HI